MSLIMSIVIFISFSGFMKVMLTAQRIRSSEMNYNLELSAITDDDKNNNEITKDIIKELDKLNTIKNYASYDWQNNLNLAINIKEENINKNLKEEEKELFNNNFPKEKIGNNIVHKSNNNTLRFPGDKAISNIKLVDGSFEKDEAMKENGVILINKTYYEQPGKRGEVTLTNYKVGDVIEAEFVDSDGNTSKDKFKIMAISDEKIVGDITHNYLGLSFLTYDEVAKNLGINDLNKNHMYIDCENDESTIKVIQDLAEKYNWNFMNEIEIVEDMNQSYFVIQIFVYGFIAVISLVSVTNIVNTISTNINLRKRELAIIKSIGVTPQGFNRMIYLESILYGVISLLFGIPLGVILSMVMNRTMANVISFNLVLPWEAILISVVAVFIITFVSAYIPMKKLNKENIIDNIRQESI
ncbi:ABC transporter permease [Romboutsia sp.]|uniref:ABC transporter permease n=1 Tax=Romboutsia sp. TaxID=1965302 RepID=UPI003F3D1D79